MLSLTLQQQERERQEKAGQKESANVLQNAGIWGTASQCLNWANSGASSVGQAWSNNSGTSGFWDDPTPVKSSSATKQSAKQTAVIKAPASNQQQQQSNKANKSKNKREEELVKKLFEQNTAKTDDFTQWCNKALSGLQVSVDSKLQTFQTHITVSFTECLTKKFYTQSLRSLDSCET